MLFLHFFPFWCSAMECNLNNYAPRSSFCAFCQRVLTPNGSHREAQRDRDRSSLSDWFFYSVLPVRLVESTHLFLPPAAEWLHPYQTNSYDWELIVPSLKWIEITCKTLQLERHCLFVSVLRVPHVMHLESIRHNKVKNNLQCTYWKAIEAPCWWRFKDGGIDFKDGGIVKWKSKKERVRGVALALV